MLFKRKNDNSNLNLYNKIINFTKEKKEVNISMLQRSLSLKYLEAKNFIDKMVEDNIIYPADEKLGIYYLKQNYIDSIEVEKIPEEKLKETVDMAFESEGLRNEDRNRIMEDGRTLEGTIKDGYKNSILAQQNSTNPKFHRTPRQQELSFEFSQKYKSEIEEMENLIYDLDELVVKIRNSPKSANTYSKEMTLHTCEQEIRAYNELKNFCYKHGEGGMIYFQDSWEYCHYDWNDCFSFISKTEKYYNKLKNNN